MTEINAETIGRSFYIKPGDAYAASGNYLQMVWSEIPGIVTYKIEGLDEYDGSFVGVTMCDNSEFPEPELPMTPLFSQEAYDRFYGITEDF